jgi:ethanolamine utilization cobalamin adenosyltransferase
LSIELELEKGMTRMTKDIKEGCISSLMNSEYINKQLTTQREFKQQMNEIKETMQHRKKEFNKDTEILKKIPNGNLGNEKLSTANKILHKMSG